MVRDLHTTRMNMIKKVIYSAVNRKDIKQLLEVGTREKTI